MKLKKQSRWASVKEGKTNKIKTDMEKKRLNHRKQTEGRWRGGEWRDRVTGRWA